MEVKPVVKPMGAIPVAPVQVKPVVVAPVIAQKVVSPVSVDTIVKNTRRIVAMSFCEPRS